MMGTKWALDVFFFFLIWRSVNFYVVLCLIVSCRGFDVFFNVSRHSNKLLTFSKR